MKKAKVDNKKKRIRSPQRGDSLIQKLKKFIPDCQGNYSRLSQATGISRHTVMEKIKGDAALFEMFQDSFEATISEVEKTAFDITSEKDKNGNATQGAVTMIIFLLKTRKKELYGQNQEAPRDIPPAIITMTFEEAMAAKKAGKLKGIDTSALDGLEEK